MLQAVRPGVFVAVDASCILRLLASILQAASAITSRVSFDTRQTGAAERQASLGVTQSTDALPRIIPAQNRCAPRRSRAETSSTAPLEASTGRRRRARSENKRR